MQTHAHKPGQQTVLHTPIKMKAASHGMLLALDGFCLTRPAFPLVLQLCARAGNRLDILLVNPPKPATLMLGKFLQTLEESGIDYRLTTGEGDLADEIPLYLHRFKDISVVLLDCVDKWGKRLHPTLNVLHREGYKVITLRDGLTTDNRKTAQGHTP